MTSRVSQLQNKLQLQNIDALLVSSAINIIYLTDFAGFSKDEREAFLLITKNSQYIITDARYTEAVRKHILDFTLIEKSSGNSFSDILCRVIKKHTIKTLGIEEDNLTIAECKKISSCLNVLKHLNINTLRLTKEKREIEAIAKACNLGDKAFDYVLKKITPGVSEKELAFEIEFFIKKHGADISFPPIVAFGKNSSMPHHQTNDQRLKTKDIVLLDFGAKLNNYCSDMTRTVFFGKANAKQKRMYKTVLDAQSKALQSLYDISIYDTQVMAKNVDRVTREYIVEKGYPTIPHSLGHGIGIEVHEAPRLSPVSKEMLKEGMVFSIEPGIYLPGFGGVRIEDLVVIERNGFRILTKSPKNLIEI